MRSEPPRPRYLLCPPTYFGVEYVINPWMEGQIGAVNRERAKRQWDDLLEILEARADVEIRDPEPGLPDMCFTANGGLVFGDAFVSSRFRVPQRAPEVPFHRRWAEEAGFRLVDLPESDLFEGEGDALRATSPGDEPIVWAGYGVRSSLESHRSLAETLGVEVVSLRLVDERFYHLDTCFASLPDGRVLYYPPAFDAASLDRIAERVPEEHRLAVDDADAVRFACNAILFENTLVTNHASANLRKRLGDWNLEVVTTPLDEFLRAGGGAKCLVLDLGRGPASRAEARRSPSPISTASLGATGHLLDSGALNRALDTITDSGGSFRIEHLRAGERRDQPTVCRLVVSAPDGAALRDIVSRLEAIGFERSDADTDAHLVATTRDGVAPDDFYATTIYPTDVRVAGAWVRVGDQRMDAAIAVDRSAKPPVARCRLLRDLRVGDLVTCGDRGVRVRTPDVRRGSARGEFAFMEAATSSERSVEAVVEELALEMRRIRARNGRIVVVAGPVVVHTGGAPHLAALVREGYVQALLSGNALAVHDVEVSLYGTSLGIDLQRGTGVHGGHRHHLRAINAIRGLGSLRSAVARGVVRSGILFECVRRDVDVVLAGSIRDDGPLPETLMDLVEAQRAYARAMRDADLVLMLATMLHSIGVGNMTPAGVRLVCVDIQPATVTKLADRGSLESVGVVTDVGPFLALLATRLEVV